MMLFDEVFPSSIAELRHSLCRADDVSE